MAYSQRFYDLIRPGCIRSAQKVVPVISDLISPETVIDVGCGEGHWGAEFAVAGATQVTGIDGDYVATRRPEIDFAAVDLSREFRNGVTYDLAVSLEVAEHLPPARAESFVEDLTLLSDVILFSAAVPGQGGAGHVNERWTSYWAELFTALDYRVTGSLRWQFWNDPDVEVWYRQNLLLCHRNPVPAKRRHLFYGPAAEPVPVIHPLYWRERVLREKV